MYIVLKVKKKFIGSNVDMPNMAIKMKNLVNSMGNHFIMLKKLVPQVNQCGNTTGTEIHAIMLHFFWLSYFMAKTQVFSSVRVLRVTRVLKWLVVV